MPALRPDFPMALTVGLWSLGLEGLLFIACFPAPTPTPIYSGRPGQLGTCIWALCESFSPISWL